MKNDLPSDIFIGLCKRVNNKCGENGEKNIQKLSENHFIKRGIKKALLLKGNKNGNKKG